MRDDLKKAQVFYNTRVYQKSVPLKEMKAGNVVDICSTFYVMDVREDYWSEDDVLWSFQNSDNWSRGS